MSDPANPAPADPPAAGAKPSGTKLEAGAYEVIRARLDKHAGDLRTRLEKLNTERQRVFGNVQSTLLATERVTTRHNCTPRDMVAAGTGHFLFGYNVQLGLKTTTEIGDVLAVYEYRPEDNTFHPLPPDLLLDGTFEEDFRYIYRYYKEAAFAKFHVIGPHLYLIFQTGKKADDVKAFKFLMAEGKLTYLGNRSDHEYVYPPQQEFTWKRAGRDQHRAGPHPHISLEDRVFIECIGGDLTIKIEDNTQTGSGIYSEPVTEADQTLDDAEIHYAVVGSLILMQVRPWHEKDYRILCYNEKTREVRRLDSIRHSCVLLPDDHGIIFADGYHLQTGETKVFANGLTDMLFERRVASANGEDFLYVFHNKVSGQYLLMPYNLIQRRVENPVVCSGSSLFPDGRLLYFREGEQPQKHHAIQIWQTPFTAVESPVSGGEWLAKIGNAQVVGCMAECRQILALLEKDDSYGDLYVDLVRDTTAIADTWFWTGDERAMNLREPLTAIHQAAQAAIEEFEKVQRLRRTAGERTRAAEDKARKLIAQAGTTAPDDVIGFVHRLSELRVTRGEIISLKELRYADIPLISALEQSVVAAAEALSQQCAGFLLKPESLQPYRNAVAAEQKALEGVKKAAEAAEVDQRLIRLGGELELLIEVVSNLKIEDATQSTAIIEHISGVYTGLNQVRAALKNRRKELARVEGAAQFGAQLRLLEQAMVNYLDAAGTPEKCDELLTKVLVQIEELEARFAELEEYAEQLADKRDEAQRAFDTRRQQLLDARAQRAGALLKSAERVLAGIRHRAASFKELSEVNGYFAGDLMISKIRDIGGHLRELGDSVKADDVETRLKTLQQEAVRQLRDRKELFAEGEDLVQFGRHRFSVNTQEFDLTLVPRSDGPAYHITGTAFYEPADDAVLQGAGRLWEQSTAAETTDVYRGEFLAWRWLTENPAAEEVPPPEEITKFMTPRFAEGYTRGVHDADAHLLLSHLIPMRKAAGLLRWSPDVRARAMIFWEASQVDAEKQRLLAVLRSSGLAGKLLGPTRASARPAAEKTLTERLGDAEAAAYLTEQLASGLPFVVSSEAAEVIKNFESILTAKRARAELDKLRAGAGADLTLLHEITIEWMSAAVTADAGLIAEAAAHHVRAGGFKPGDVQAVVLHSTITGVKGEHPLMEGGKYLLDYHSFTARLQAHDRSAVPAFQAFTASRTAALAKRRGELGLEEFKPKVMTAFVRNRLISEVYLPLVGANLAKQIGASGADKRTDRMGLLLLISPPGYGKTTLVEYVASRLGLAFIKINGPALGHAVTSLDPAEARNASARNELEKLNLALEMGDNVLICIDDIQHTNPEFLQKFISLCDAQRRIEGVWRGAPQTYDLRGRKVCIVMCGNPYTESGAKFQIPDMLANRADTYNLGDVAGGNVEAFKASYVENSLTSHPVLSRLAGRGQQDVHSLLRLAATGSSEGLAFEGNWTAAELDEMANLCRKLLRVRDTILQVNQNYIASAAQQDAWRTEPAFKLQGSYRNMNRIAEKLQPLMTDAEVNQVILDHYLNESQTLAANAEANLLKFRELEGILTPAEAKRWQEIKEAFRRQMLLGGAGTDDPVGRVVGQLALFAEGLKHLGGTLQAMHQTQAHPATLADVTVERLEKIISALRAVPVDVQINVVPVEQSSEGGGRITSAEGSRNTAPIEIIPEVRQPSADRAEGKGDV